MHTLRSLATFAFLLSLHTVATAQARTGMVLMCASIHLAIKMSCRLVATLAWITFINVVKVCGTITRRQLVRALMTFSL